MKADWTPSGGSLVTLADDSVKVPMVMEPPFGLEDAEQTDELAFGATVFQAPRGNSKGSCIFTAAKSHATRATALGYAKTQQTYRGALGVLVLTESTGTITMNALLKSAVVVRMQGLRWTVRYVFQITSLT